MTKYAKQLLELINQSKEHLSAEQLFLELKKTEHKVVLATVYNNLNTLCSEDLIRKISMEGSPDRYDKIRRHDHLICKRCGKLSDIMFEDLAGRLEEQLRENILSYDLRVFYLCPECRTKEENS